MAMEYINMKFTDNLTPIFAKLWKPDNWRDIVAVNPDQNFITAPKEFTWENSRDKIRKSLQPWNSQSRELEYCPPKVPPEYMIYYLLLFKYIKNRDKDKFVEMEVIDELHYPEIRETKNYGYPIGNAKDLKKEILDLKEGDIYRLYVLSEDGANQTYAAWKNIHHQNTNKENNKSYYKANKPEYNNGYGYFSSDTDE